MIKTDKTRRIIQLFFLSVSILLFLLLIIGVFEIAHAYCPYSTVCFGCLNTGQQLRAHFFPAAAVVGILIVIFSIFWGRRFCGYACPFGTIQELIFTLNPRSSKANKHNLIPHQVHKYLKWLKYVVFAATAILAGLGMGYIYMQFCPVMSIAHVQSIRIAGVISILIIFVGGFFVERFWCNYLCPYAALLNIGQYLGKLLHIPRRKIHWNKENCIHCNLCDKFCPMQINVKSSEQVEDPECINCHRCELYCPLLKKLETRK